jgi:PEP-CTERM motif
MKIASTILLTLGACLLVAGPTQAQTACSAGATTFMTEENPAAVPPVPEGSINVTCAGFTFPTAQTVVLLDASGLPSDVIILANNLLGEATISFVSDTLDLPLTLPTGNLIRVSESTPFVAIAVSTVAGVSSSALHFISDTDTAGSASPCGTNSDCMTASTSTVPEPATMGLLGIGLLASGWIQRRRRQRQVAV